MDDFFYRTAEVFFRMCDHRRQIQSPFTVAGDESAFNKALLHKLGHLKIDILIKKKEDIFFWIDGLRLHADDRRHLKRIILRIIEFNHYLGGGPAPHYRTGRIRLGRWEVVAGDQSNLKLED